MKLYEVPPKSTIKLTQNTENPPYSMPTKKDEILYFSHIDGMYSYCRTRAGLLVHPAAWTEVEIIQ